MDVNFYGVVRVTRTFLPLIRKSKGRVVNLISMAGRVGCPFMSAYGASKHACIAFTESLALEMQPFNVKVLSIEPWFYKTPLLNLDMFCRDIKSQWAYASTEVREAYGADMETKAIAVAYHLCASKANVEPDLQHVVDALVDAVTSIEPNPYNQVMSHLRKVVIKLVIDFLPYEMRLKLMQLRLGRIMDGAVNSV